MNTTTPTVAPDWSTLQDQILCPLCDYNLRGLTLPRCPECGYQFDWPELLNPAHRHHPYLFELHPQRNLGSFWQTLTATLFPRSFWKSLHPIHPRNLRRLLLYGLITAIISSLPLLVFAIPLVSRRCSYGNLGPLRSTIHLWIYPTAAGQLVTPLLQTPLRTLAICLVLAYLIWPLATFALLMIFQSSMRLARIRPVHVLRCVIYSADLSFWIGPLLATAIVTAAIHPNHINERVWWACLVFCLLVFFVAIYRLVLAYRYYLRFHRATATILATQLIIALLTLILLGGTSAGWFRPFF